MAPRLLFMVDLVLQDDGAFSLKTFFLTWMLVEVPVSSKALV